MNTTLFARPIFVRQGNRLVREIADLDDAIDFLADWPEQDRDLLHETALRTLIAVHDGLKPLSAAQAAIEGFARKKRILERPEDMMPWIAACMKKSGSHPA